VVDWVDLGSVQTVPDNLLSTIAVTWDRAGEVVRSLTEYILVDAASKLRRQKEKRRSASFTIRTAFLVSTEAISPPSV
jgi:hypothetical protein